MMSALNENENPAKSKELDIDRLSTYDFIAQVYSEVTPQELFSIGSKLDARSNYYKKMLSPNKIDNLKTQEIKELIQSSFAIRKLSKKWTEEDFNSIIPAIKVLLHSKDPLINRFNRFCQFIQSKYKIKYPFDFTSEILYFYDPDTYWVWSKWMFDPHVNTGSLLLVLEEGVNLDAPTFGNQYQIIGQSIRKVESIATEIGIREPNTSPTSKFEITIFLCAVYAVYMYTITRMRMTKEFNTILPKMLELIKRLLGIQRKADLAKYGLEKSENNE